MTMSNYPQTFFQQSINNFVFLWTPPNTNQYTFITRIIPVFSTFTAEPTWLLAVAGNSTLIQLNIRRFLDQGRDAGISTGIAFEPFRPYALQPGEVLCIQDPNNVTTYDSVSIEYYQQQSGGSNRGGRTQVDNAILTGGR